MNFKQEKLQELLLGFLTGLLAGLFAGVVLVILGVSAILFIFIAIAIFFFASVLLERGANSNGFSLNDTPLDKEENDGNSNSL